MSGPVEAAHSVDMTLVTHKAVRNVTEAVAFCRDVIRKGCFADPVDVARAKCFALHHGLYGLFEDIDAAANPSLENFLTKANHAFQSAEATHAA